MTTAVGCEKNKVKMSKPYISIIIPTRNRPSDLANCIAGLEQQIDHPPFEVLVVDDHSEKGVKNEYNHISLICNGLNLKILSTPKNQRGAVFARNFGLSCACGEIVAFLDDDCIAATNWLATIYHYFSNYPEISAITGWIDAVELVNPLSAFRQNFYDSRYRKLMRPETAQVIQRRFNLYTLDGLYLADNLSGGNSAARLSALRNVDGFDTSFQMMHDKELSLRLLKDKYLCIFVPSLKVKHVHTKSTRDAIRKSFYSGKYRHKLQQKHGGFLSHRVIAPLRPVQIIINSRLFLFSLKKKGWNLAFIIVLMEYLHQLGYLNEMILNKLRTLFNN